MLHNFPLKEDCNTLTAIANTSTVDPLDRYCC